ncbi:class II fructose-bisphosphate aldolase [Calidithermus timidus]|jgi:fructose/tagatose bisphosphate aldolase|uniref:class II fructose-bisphosphate aldolase n=1 Tax=Calidithermus timidus TaxID=307124 RepID=UPI0003732D6F|nr:class II fructose-bisphosphate aldolase [Calidithermus timidus]
MLLDALQARELFKLALKRRFAVLAVNVDSPAALTDCLEAARRTQAPIILQTSLWQLNSHSFGAGDALTGMARFIAQLAVLATSERYGNVPVLYHTDHIKGPQTLKILGAAIRGLPVKLEGSEVRLRASTLSLDSSELSEAQNIATVKRLCQIAAESGLELTLEMEAGVDEGPTPLEVAERLLLGVEREYPGKVYLWAPGVGTRHGLGDQSAFSSDAVAQHQALASRLTGRPIGIALHGSSGLSPASLQAAVRAGVCKVNWSSESLLLRSRAAQEYYATHVAELQPGHPRWKAAAMDDGLQRYIAERYVPVVMERIRLLGGSGMAPLLLEHLGVSA